MASDDQDFVVLGDKDLADFNADGLLPQSVEEITKIQKWLNPTDYNSESSEYNKHKASYTPGTGKWIQETEQYQQWIDSPDCGTLWIKGVAGSGKSVVAANVASLLEPTKVPILHFFFRQIIAANKTPQSLVRDWLSQLLQFSPWLQFKLKMLVKEGRILDSVSFDDLWELLVSAVSATAGKVYCIADALDEMDFGNDLFMQKLAELNQKYPSSIKVLMTSRPLPYIEKALAHTGLVQLVLRSQLVDQDILKYLSTKLNGTALPQDSKAEIERVLGGKSQGLFLYARLMLDEILGSSKSDFESICDALEKLPSGLGDMYTRMLNEHSIRSETPQDLQLLILQCVTHCSRPLRLLELSTVADFVRKTSHYQVFSPPMGLSKDTKSIIRNGCGPLLEILEDETVSIIHHSFTEYLTDPQRNPSSSNGNQFPHVDLSETHLAIAKLCVSYLLSDWLPDHDNANDSTSNMSSSRLSHPFLDYALNNWSYHVSKYGKVDDELFQLLDRLMEPKSNSLSLCLRFMSLGVRSDEVSHGSKSISPFHICALKGLTAYSAHLIQLGQDMNTLDPELRTPLHRAAEKGHHGVAEALLKNGASNNMDDCAGLTPLHLAASTNHGAIVKSLLEAGVDPFTPKTRENPGRMCGNAKSTRGETAVEYASEYGHTEALLELLPFLDEDGLSKALGWSASNGRTENVLAILSASKLDVNKMFQGKTPIHAAAYAHDIVSMRKLQDLGADVRIKSNNIFSHDGIRCMSVEDECKYTPLHVFAENCRGILKNSISDTLEGIKLLLSAGCDINEYSGSGVTPLQHAISSTASYFHSNACPTEIVEFLIENGADISLPARDGSTVLHLAAAELEGTIDLLVANGADVNARRVRDGRTPLLCATGGYSETTMLALIKHGADCNAHDGEGITALQIALEVYSTSLTKVKALLANGANPNYRNKKGDTALHVMRSWARQSDLLSSLLAANADLEAKTADGLTVLLRAVKNNADLVDIKSLITAGAKIDVRDFAGRTVLHHCCEKENCIALLGALIDMGADPSLTDFAGNTLFHQVARQPPSYHEKEQLELLTTLLELGVSPLSTNNAGQTPLHIAAGMNRATKRWIRYKTDPFEFLLGPRCSADINAPDNKGIRPIHLAATLSEAQVQELLDHGADPLVLTIGGQSVLHVASRARQSNTVGMMIELYNKLAQAPVNELGKSQSKEIGCSPMIDLVDKDGRTALHHAVRSGRLESVSVLLEMGRANPNVRDVGGKSPLDMCIQFREENARWQASATVFDGPAYMQAAYVTLDDLFRPLNFENGNSPTRFNLGSEITSEFQTVGIRQIIRLLIQNGADVSFMNATDSRRPYSGRHTLLEAAIEADCEVLVDELLCLENISPNDKKQTEKKPKLLSESDDSSDDSDIEEDDGGVWRYYTTWKSFAEKYVALRSQSSSKLLDGIVEPGKSNLTTFRTLLQTENERGVEEFKRLGADLLRPQWNGESCITMLVKWGYASLLKKLRSETALVTDEWMVETEKIDCNLPGRLRYLLHIACERSLPNLEVLKALPLHDINCQRKNDGQTALHILAHSTHWWQSHAMEYLLEQGADPNIRDQSGKTALFIAVGGARKEMAVKSLLRYGADPNILDNGGLACLNLAGSNASVVEQLIKAGANVSAGKKPFVFDSISAFDLQTVKLLREIGSDFNIRPTPEEEEEDPSDDSKHRRAQRRRQKLFNSRTVAEMSYPVHYAASAIFNGSSSKEKMVPIIQELLKGNANPLLTFNEKGDSIIHDIFENEGIVEPFLEIPDLDLEARDSNGKTYLLAACSTADNYWRSHDMKWLVAQPSPAQLVLAKGADIAAIDNEGRNVFHHLLKSSFRYSTLRACHPTDFKNFLAHPQAATLAVQKDAKGATPLHHALRGSQLWAIDLLLAKGADPHEADSDGNTALHHLASQFCSPSPYCDPNPLTAPLFKKFRSFGISINTPNFAGETPLFKLISSSGFCMDNLQMFENKGADLMVRDKMGRGLLHAIAKRGNILTKKDGVEGMEVGIFRYLMGKGLDPMMEDAEQRSSLDVAMASGSVGILEIFKREKYEVSRGGLEE